MFSLAGIVSQASLLVLVLMLAACGGGGSGGGAAAPADTTPDAFSFLAVTAAGPGEVVTSAAVTLAGFSGSVAIGITGGEFSVDGGAFGSAANTVRSGQSVRVRLTAPSALGQATSATLTVGGISGRFDVTTRTESDAPTVTIDFPGENTVTHDDSFLLRGTVRDATGVQTVTVNGTAVPITRTGTNATFSERVPVELENRTTALVRATDTLGNATGQATNVTVRHTRLIGTPSAVAITADNGRIYAVQELNGDVFEITPSVNGARRIASLGEPFRRAIPVLDEAGGRLLVIGDDQAGSFHLAQIRLDTGATITRVLAHGLGNAGFNVIDAAYRQADQSIYFMPQLGGNVLQVSAPVDLVGARYLGGVVSAPIIGVRAFSLDGERLLVLHHTGDPNETRISAWSLTSSTLTTLYTATEQLAAFRASTTIDFQTGGNALYLLGPDQFIVVQSGFVSVFGNPDGDALYSIGSPRMHRYDAAAGVLRFSDTTLPFLAAIDVRTGGRLGGYSNGVGHGLPAVAPRVLAWDAEARVVYALDGLGQYDVLRYGAQPGNAARIARVDSGRGDAPADMVLDAARGRLLVVHGDRVQAIATSTGVVSTFSAAGVAGAGPAIGIAVGAALDVTANRLLVTDAGTNAIIAIDLTTGDRSLVSQAGGVGAGPELAGLGNIAIVPGVRRAYVFAGDGMRNVYAIDLTNGDRTVALDRCPTSTGFNVLANGASIELDVSEDGATVFMGIGPIARWQVGATMCDVLPLPEGNIVLDFVATANRTLLASTFATLTRIDDTTGAYVVIAP